MRDKRNDFLKANKRNEEILKNDALTTDKEDLDEYIGAKLAEAASQSQEGDDKDGGA